MPAILQLKPLPRNHGNQIMEMWIVCRSTADPGATEIAEHPDGAMKAYASKDQAERARRELAISGDADGKNPWIVETIWLLHKGFDVCPEAMALAETGMFSESAVRSIDLLMTTLRNRRG